MANEQSQPKRPKRTKAEKDEEKAQRREARESEAEAQQEQPIASEGEPSEAVEHHETEAPEGSLRSPRDLDRRPPSGGGDSSAGPAHVRSGRGVRTTAETDEELREEAYQESISEGYERTEWRTDGAGPNPYHLEGTRERIGGAEIAAEMTKEIIEADGAYFLQERQVASFLASSADDDYTASASDAEVASIGETFVDTGQKLVENPDRVDAQDRAVLQRIDQKHSGALQAHEDAVGEGDTIADDYRVAAAHAEATEVSDDPLRADAASWGGLYGGAPSGASAGATHEEESEEEKDKEKEH